MSFLGGSGTDDNREAVITNTSSTEIVVEVPVGAVSGPVEVSVNGELVQSAVFMVIPSITDIDPTSGVVSSEVRISGTSFSTIDGENEVSFLGEAGTDDNREAVITNTSSTEIVVEVPEGAVSGPISVSVNGELVQSDVFTIAPTISSIDPMLGSVSTPVTITGTGFSPTVLDNSVRFLGTSSSGDEELAIITSVNSTGRELIVSVPDGALSGPIEVDVNGEVVQTVFFTVIVDRDTDNDGLIDVTNLEQLDAIRFDLNGDGMIDESVSMSDSISYEMAFSIGRRGVVSCTDGCRGYGLMTSLDFEDADGSGPGTDKSRWAEGANLDGVSGAVRNGWNPIGDISSPSTSRYNTIFNGNNYIIYNIYIDRDFGRLGTHNVGLFGYLGEDAEIRNLGLEGGSVKGSDNVGCLVGTNLGTIRSCYTTGDATGREDTGALVGSNGGTIIACYATGEAIATHSGNAGALVGVNSGLGAFEAKIVACYATGNAEARGPSSKAGGLVGLNQNAEILASYATGNATGISESGGLVGENSGVIGENATIAACYSTGRVEAISDAGGLVGKNNDRGRIIACYTTAISIGETVGGLVGLNDSGTITDSYFDYHTSDQEATEEYAKSTSDLQTPTSYGTGLSIYANWNIELDNELSIGVENSKVAGDLGVDNPWDFGTSAQYPALKVDFDVSGVATVDEFGDQPRIAPLRIRNIDPTLGPVSTIVTITGSGFSLTSSENTVSFGGGVNGVVGLGSSSTELIVSVPDGAVSGPVEVDVNGEVVQTVFFTVSVDRDMNMNSLIEVSSLEQLDAIRFDLNGDGIVDENVSVSDSISYETAFNIGRKGAVSCTGSCSGYELTTNLDFASTKWENPTGGTFGGVRVTGGWEPIGDGSLVDPSDRIGPQRRYTSIFEGNDYTISNLYIDRSSDSEVGLFGVVGSSGKVRNIGVEGGTVVGDYSIGCLAGSNFGAIQGCYSTSDATTPGGSGSVGSLVGRNFTSATITACYATGTVVSEGFNANAGGLVGENKGEIRACYATGSVTGTVVGFTGTVSMRTGGLVGSNYNGTIRASYATGTVNGIGVIGGLVGLNDLGRIIACYARGNTSTSGTDTGGLVGQNGSGTIRNSYFDYQISLREPTEPYAKSTYELVTSDYSTGTSIYANWNIDLDNNLTVGVDNGKLSGDPGVDDPWDFGTNSQYPVLKVDFDRNGTPTATEFGNQPRIASLSIRSISPTYGSVGGTVQITGTTFTSSANVTFLGSTGASDNKVVSATFVNSTELTVSVPNGAVTGPIEVSVNGEVVQTAVFTIVPTITGIAPDRGPVSTEVTISGSGFSPTSSENSVRFLGMSVSGDEEEASITSVNSRGTELIVSVPDGAVSGPIEVSVNGEIVQTAVFTIAPTITGIDPTSGPVSTEVTISGSGFSPTASGNSVRFLGTSVSGDEEEASITSVNSRGAELIVSVPDGAVSGPISVSVNGEVVQTSVFTVDPTITGIAPDRGPVSTIVTIRGSGFSPTSSENSVRFLGTSVSGDEEEASITSVNSIGTELVVSVPDGAVSGPIEVEVNGEVVQKRLSLR